MRILCLLLALTACGVNRYPTKRPLDERFGWYAGSMYSVAAIGAATTWTGVNVAGADCSSSSCHDAVDAALPWAVAGTAAAGAVTGYFLGRCAEEEDGGACRALTITAGIIATGITGFAVTLALFGGSNG